MKKHLAVAVLLFGVQAAVAHAGVNMDINFGYPAPVVVVPLQPPPPRFMNETSRFIFSPALGFHVSVGSPYDIVCIRESYYMYGGGNWYRARHADGPWLMIGWQILPPELHQHKLGEISRYRDFAARNFERDREHYSGRWYTREARREERREERRKERYEVRRDEYRNDHRDDQRDEHRDDFRERR